MEKFTSIKSLLEDEERFCNTLNRWNNDFDIMKTKMKKEMDRKRDKFKGDIDFYLICYWKNKNYIKQLKRECQRDKQYFKEIFKGKRLYDQLSSRTAEYNEKVKHWREFTNTHILKVRQNQKKLAILEEHIINLDSHKTPKIFPEYQEELQTLKYIRQEIKKALNM